jgi:probable addiction module antidote protein
MKNIGKASVDHNEALVQELRADPELALEYLKATLEEDDDHSFRSGLLRLAQAYGVQDIADKAGIKRENVYRALSGKGNPTLKTFTSIVNAMGLRLTVERQKGATERKGHAA